MNFRDPVFHMQMREFSERFRASCAAERVVVIVSGHDDPVDMPGRVSMMAERVPAERPSEHMARMVADMLSATASVMAQTNFRLYTSKDGEPPEPWTNDDDALVTWSEKVTSPADSR